MGGMYKKGFGSGGGGFEGDINEILPKRDHGLSGPFESATASVFLSCLYN
jgi:hypothetical protein